MSTRLWSLGFPRGRQPDLLSVTTVIGPYVNWYVAVIYILDADAINRFATTRKALF